MDKIQQASHTSIIKSARGIGDLITSILILTNNRLEHTKTCIESIHSSTKPGTYEIIVVDLDSSDGTQEWLKQQTEIITIFNEEYIGFSKGCNQGIEIATGDNLLLLSSDTIVTKDGISNLLKGLYSSEEIGAVGPLTNNPSYYQNIKVDFKSLDEILVFGRQHNFHDPSKWEQRLKLSKFCMLIKREVIEKVGFIDEIFSSGHLEDDDYSFRIMQAGYKLMLCKDVFIYHLGLVSFGGEGQETALMLKDNEGKFEAKWGFNSRYSAFIRYDIINLIDIHEENEAIRVLEVGCACGGTLLQIKNKYKNAKLYGIELNESSAGIASLFANVIASDVGNALNYPLEFFDYIILPDVLEHLYNPWQVLKNLKRHIKKSGKVIASIPNIMHYSVIGEILRGSFTYTDAGLLDRTHIRFFTLSEIIKMFQQGGYNNIQYSTNILPISDQDDKWIDALAQLGDPMVKDQFKVYQYLIKAHNYNLRSLDVMLQEIDTTVGKSESVMNLIGIIREEQISCEVIIDAVNRIVFNKQDIYNILATCFFAQGHMEYIMPFLQESLLINGNHKDTLYNIGNILHIVEEKEMALHYLELINEKDFEVIQLIERIQLELNI